MDLFYGFDLGDAESAIARIDRTESTEPEILSILDAKSLISAYALLKDGTLVIGENACYVPKAIERRIRFKSGWLSDPEAPDHIRRFAEGVLAELYRSGQLRKDSDSCFYIGCPAGWNANAREDYRRIFQDLSYPPVRIISESRAALVASTQSKHLQVGYDILSRPVLVVDIGSSTTDFAYILSGHEEKLQTGGEVVLGGGIMDEILLEECVKSSHEEKRIRRIFEESPAWKTYCEFAARKLKERYFSDAAYWKDNACVDSVTIRYRLPVRLNLEMNEKRADALLNTRVEKLGNRSFMEVYRNALDEVRNSITTDQPELVFMTGGVSRMKPIVEATRNAFPTSVCITSAAPEFSVAEGLAWCGRIDDDLRAFKEEVQQLISSSTVEQIVEDNIPDLYKRAVDTLTDPILENAALPVIERWANGEIEKLADIDAEMEKSIRDYLSSTDARKLMVHPIAAWMKKISYAMEDKTVPICVKYHVPYSALSLSSYLSLGDIDIHVDTKDVFAVEEITWIIDTVISLLIGLLCGGSGIALVAQGPQGLVTGAFLSLIVLALGKNKMQELIVNAKLPKPMRKLIPRSYIKSRMEAISSQVKEDLRKSLEQEQNEEITQRLVSEISRQIEECLTRMAEVVEIPLG